MDNLAIILEGSDDMQATSSNSEHNQHYAERKHSLKHTTSVELTLNIDKVLTSQGTGMASANVSRLLTI